ncbi:MAG: cation:proton antiporter [Pseudomonadota bacterium]|nr:cation:proton antiporter [Pseudomonadota bacterium]
MPHALQSILVLLAAAVLVVVLCRIVQLPAIVGYLLVGVAVGPHALGWVDDAPQTRYLAEFGIVFLMFSVGLEFSLPQLTAMRRAVFGLGLAQVVITATVPTVALTALGMPWQAGLALGSAAAMSSTAIVSRLLTERIELGTPHGRDILGILLFQDLAVIALLILLPGLSEPGTDPGRSFAIAFAKAAVVLGLILYAGQRPMRAWFHVVARQRSSELFMLNVLLITLGLAALTEAAGLSLALGAFVAGMLIAETEYRYQVEEDIKPFRDVLLGLFFVVVGMALDVRILVHEALWVLATLAVLVLMKGGIIVALSRAFGAPTAVAWRTGFYLAHAGEFALVLLTIALGHGLVGSRVGQVTLAAMVLSMLVAPLLIQLADRVVRRLTANDWLARAAQVTELAASTMARQDHVIICGYGRSGQNVARLLQREDIPYIALDSDPQRVREASGDARVVYADAGRRETLLASGLGKTRAVVVSFADTAIALRILHHVRAARADVPIIVRTRDDSELDMLLNAGATEVVPEVLEGSLMLASHSLLVMGVPLMRVLARIRAVREERYSLFRGFYHGATDASDAADNLHPRLHSVTLPERAFAVGRTIGEIDLDHRVEVTGVRRHGSRLPAVLPDLALAPGDVLVLLGRPEQLAMAEARLLQGTAM